MIDDLDSQIIDVLSVDGRRSNARIARTLGVSEGTIRRRLNIMRSEKVIDVKVLLNSAYLTSETEAIIGIQIDMPLINKVVSQLNNIEEVTWVNIVSGSFDIFINITTKSLEELLKLLQNEIGNIEGIKKIETFTTLEVSRDKYRGI